MNRADAQLLKAVLKQSLYVDKRTITIRKLYRGGFEVTFAEGGCGYAFDTLAQAEQMGFFGKGRVGADVS